MKAAAGEDPEDGPHFVLRAGLPDQRSGTFQVAEVAFAPDGVKGTENLLFNHALGEIPRPETFLGRWHRARIAYDLTNYTGSVWVDNEPVLAGVPLRADLDVESPPEISLTRDGSVPVELWIDDVGVEFVDLSLLGRDAADVAFRPLFRDNFNRYESALFPRQGGWSAFPAGTSAGEKVGGEAAEEGAEVLRAAKDEAVSSGVDDRVYASSARSFKLEGTDEEPGRATKRFSLPERVPSCVSAEPFAIVASGEAGQTEGRAAPSRDRETESKRRKRWDNQKEGRTRRLARRSGPASSKPAAGPVRSGSSEGMEDAMLMSGVPVSGAFYIYAFDGRLLAEYDVAGALVRDYIYFGGQLVAEYTGTQLFYYASDQINSTRIVTDSSGTVVYAVAHEPYGGIQKTWVTTYDPALKFSGKQRDAESDLDYFGARYYDRSLYRFLSVDPVIPGGAAMDSPQRWNLYSYCGNNPLTYLDPDGRSYLIFSQYSGQLYAYSGSGVLMGTFSAHNDVAKGKETFELGWFPCYGYNQHLDDSIDDSIDYYGFFSFRTINKEGKIAYDMGVHAGGKRGLKTKTNGCIRTTQDAMYLMVYLEFVLGDPIDCIYVTSEYRVVGGSLEPALSPEEIRKRREAAEAFVFGMLSFYNMIEDYFFTTGPIPPGAR